MSLIHDVMKCGFFSYGLNGRRGLNLMLVGDPGEGKTAIVRSFARHVGGMFASLEGSRLEPQDVIGLPRFDEGKDSFSFAPPALFRRLAGASPGLLFVDEFTRACSSVQSALLNVILDGETEAIDLGPGVARWAACNPAAMVGGVALDPANASRFLWVEWPAMTAADFRDYLLTADGVTGDGAGEWKFAAREAEEVFRKGWGREVGLARTYIASFLTRNPSHLRETPPDEARAWSNPRTWDLAARALASAGVHGMGWDVKAPLLGGCVGRGPADAFLTWLRTMDLPDPADLLDGKVQYDMTGDTRTDRIYTVLDATMSVIQTGTADAEQEERTAKRIQAWVGMLAAVSARKDVRDIAAVSVARAMGIPAFFQNSVFMQEIMKLRDFVRVIGAFSPSK